MNHTQSTALAFAIAISLTAIIGAISACAPDTTHPTTCPDTTCSINPANPVNPVQTPHTETPLAWPGTLAQAYASDASQIVAVVWNPGCSYCNRATPILNDPACYTALIVDRGYALANVKASTADGQRLLSRARILEFPAVIILRKTGGAWDVYAARAYRPAAPSVPDFLAFIATLNK